MMEYDFDKAVSKISDHLEELLGDPAVHSPGSYEEILNSTSSSTWGWTEPLLINGLSVVYYQVSPSSKGAYSYIIFDFIQIGMVQADM